MLIKYSGNVCLQMLIFREVPPPPKPPIRGGGLHVTCDAHFRTRMSYSSQKSCVKIWFGLVEIGGM